MKIIIKYLIATILISAGKTAFLQNDRNIGTLEVYEPVYKNVRALIIGISDYSSEAISDLDYADDDAISVYDFISSPIGWNIDTNNITVLPNHKATSARIKTELINLYNSTEPNDLVIIYFAGHGDVAESFGENEGYLLAHDASGPSGYAIDGALSVNYLEKAVSGMAKKDAKVLLITDACRSGKVVTQGGAEQTLAALTANWQNVMKLVSSQANQLSQEGRQWGNGHGVFTYYLIEGLSGLADGIYGQEDQQISLLELYNYIMPVISTETNGTQIPAFSGNATAHIGDVNPEAKALALENKGKGTIPTLFAMRSTSDKTLYDLDSAQFQLFQDFKTAIKEKKFIEPDQDNAYQYYLDLTNTHITEDLQTRMEGSLALAMQDDAQQMINQYLQGVIDLPLGSDYKRGARQLKLALELLGPDNIFHEDFEKRINFMEGYSVIRSANRKNYPEAVKLLETAVEQEPHAAYAHAALGRLYSNLHRFNEAMVEASKAIDIAPNWVYAHKLLGDIYLDQRRYREAREQYQKTLEVYPGHPWVLNNLGVVYHRQGRYREAAEFYHLSIENRNDTTVPIQNLAHIAMKEGRYKESRDLYLAAIASNPKYNIAYRQLGDLYVDLGFTEAEHLYIKAVELEPYKAAPLIDLAYLYRTTKPEESLELTLKAIELNPLYVWGYNRLGWFHLSKGKYDEAEQAFLAAIEKIPHAPEAYRNLASFYKNRKRYEEAETYYSKSIRVDSLYFDAYLGLANLYEKQKLPGKAEASYLKAHELFPESPDLSMELADFYYRRLDYDNAEKYYRITVEIDPSYAKAYTNLAYTLLEQKHFAEASGLFKEAIQNNPYQNNPSDVAIMIDLYAYQMLYEKDTVKAIEAYTQSLEFDSTNVNALFQLANMYYFDGKFEEAKPYIDNALKQENLTQSYHLKYLSLQGKIMIDMGEDKKALQNFNTIIDLSLRTDFLGKAICLFNLKKRNELKAFLDFIREENPMLLSNKHIHTNYSNNAINVLTQIIQDENEK